MQSAVYFNESYNQLQPITCKYNDYILFLYIYIHVDCEHCGCLRDVVATTQAEKKGYGCVYIYICIYIYLNYGTCIYCNNFIFRDSMHVLN